MNAGTNWAVVGFHRKVDGVLTEFWEEGSEATIVDDFPSPVINPRSVGGPTKIALERDKIEFRRWSEIVLEPSQTVPNLESGRRCTLVSQTVPDFFRLVAPKSAAIAFQIQHPISSRQRSDDKAPRTSSISSSPRLRIWAASGRLRVGFGWPNGLLRPYGWPNSSCAPSVTTLKVRNLGESRIYACGKSSSRGGLDSPSRPLVTKGERSISRVLAPAFEARVKWQYGEKLQPCLNGDLGEFFCTLTLHWTCSDDRYSSSQYRTAFNVRT